MDSGLKYTLEFSDEYELKKKKKTICTVLCTDKLELVTAGSKGFVWKLDSEENLFLFFFF